MGKISEENMTTIRPFVCEDLFRFNNVYVSEVVVPDCIYISFTAKHNCCCVELLNRQWKQQMYSTCLPLIDWLIDCYYFVSILRIFHYIDFTNMDWKIRKFTLWLHYYLSINTNFNSITIMIFIFFHFQEFRSSDRNGILLVVSENVNVVKSVLNQ